MDSSSTWFRMLRFLVCISSIAILLAYQSLVCRSAESGDTNRRRFDEAYRLYRKSEYGAARKVLESIPAKAANADAMALQVRLGFCAKVQELTSVESDAATDLLRTLRSKPNVLHSSYSDLVAIAEREPKSAIVQELLGSVAAELALFYESLAKEPAEGEKYKTSASKAFHRSVEIDASRAVAHAGIAASIMQSRNFDCSDPSIAEHLIQGVENAADDPACVRMLVVVMWNSPMMKNAQKKSRVSNALLKLRGDAVEELKESRVEVKGLLAQARLASERIAATGFGSRATDDSIALFEATLIAIDAAIER